jgi:hypothetical protein
VSGRALRLVQRMLVGREDALARQWQRRLENAASPGYRAFLRAMTVTPGRGRVVMATTRNSQGEWTWLGLPVEQLTGYHAGIAGGTGTGKTTLVLVILFQIALENRSSLLVFDAKGETAALVLDLLVPVLLKVEGGEVLLDRLRVIRPFDPTNVPLLNITRAERGVPKEAQAYGVASAVEQALAEPLGGRMHHVLVRGATLCIELGLPITDLQRWLEDPRSFLKAAARSSDAALREYVRIGFPQENRESIRALASRLNALLFWPGAREALCAPGTMSFADALAEPGLTVVDVGNPPSGAERLARFFGAALLGQMARAILSRPVTPETHSALLLAEEIQEVLGPEEARQLGRLFATARYKRTAVWTTNQSRSQLAAVDPALVAAMRANLGLQVQFRTSPEDAAAFAYMLPEEAGGDEGRRELIHSLTRLPQRHCYLAVRDVGLHAQLVLSPRINFEALRKQAEQTSPEVFERIRRGIAALPRSTEPSPVARSLAESLAEDTGPASSTRDDPEFPGLG